MKRDLKLLKLVEILKELKVSAYADYVVIENEDFELKAEIYNNGVVDYFVTGIYNSGTNDKEIDMDALADLKKVAEEISKELKEEE